MGVAMHSLQTASKMSATTNLVSTFLQPFWYVFLCECLFSWNSLIVTLNVDHNLLVFSHSKLLKKPFHSHHLYLFSWCYINTTINGLHLSLRGWSLFKERGVHFSGGGSWIHSTLLWVGSQKEQGPFRGRSWYTHQISWISTILLLNWMN